ncbi:MAG: guanylate kinase [Deltaproteobacteria bacterium]|nr:guanylate kinase [Deltaproteobacteria bacterium]
MKKGLLFVISAPSGTGKTTLCRAMIEVFPGLHYSISYTTRPPRPGDENGRDYHFISPAEFQERIDRNDFAEWAEIYGYRYGTSRSLIEKIRGEGRDVILDIDGQGARQLRKQDLGGILIFLLPPSLEELRGRLSRRGTEAEAAIQERLRKAQLEMAEARGYDYLIVNDDLEKTKERLKAVILAEHQRRDQMEEVLERLLREKVDFP